MRFALSGGITRKGACLLLAGGLLAFMVSGCQGAAETSSAAAEPALTTSSSVAVRAEGSAASEPPAVGPQTSWGELTLDDYSVYQAQQRQLDLEAVAFYRFSFAQNAQANRLDSTQITTLRGLGLASAQEELSALYGGIPVEIGQYSGPNEEWQVLQYEEITDYLDSEESQPEYVAVFSLYFLNGTAEPNPYTAQAAAQANAYNPQYSVVRYDLAVQVADGEVGDIVLSKNDITPYVPGYLAPARAIEEENLTVDVTGISAQPGGLCVGLALHYSGEVPVRASCTLSMVSGKATRDAGVLDVELSAGGYAEALLVIPNDAIHAAGVNEVESVGFVLQLTAEDGTVVQEGTSPALPVIQQ